jgi:hypothetical protein
LAFGGAVRYSDRKPRHEAAVGGVQVLPETVTEDSWAVNPFVS